MDFLEQKLSNYINQHTQEEHPLLKDLSRETHIKALLPQMLSGHPQGLFLKMISQMIKPRIILEIGTKKGGTLFLWSRITKAELIISIDLFMGPHGGGYSPKKKKFYSLVSYEYLEFHI